MSQRAVVNEGTDVKHTDHVDGILNIDKPPRITSMDVVRHVKKIVGHKRVGHGGTLDPIATGVIPVCLGKSTKMMDYMIQGTREYRTVIELGIQTDSYDALGNVTDRKNVPMLDSAEIESALQTYVGIIDQVPPMFSALKQQGKRLYELAREGVEVKRAPRQVNVMKLKLLDSKLPYLTIDITCGRGFYVRSLAHDLGIKLGCGAHMKSLQRLRSGPFKLSDSTTLNTFDENFINGTWRTLIYPPDITVSHLRSMVVNGEGETRIRNGRTLCPDLSIPSPTPNEKCRVYGHDGRFLAIMSFKAAEGLWQPERVFNFPL